MPSFKSAVLAAAVALPTLSFADSAINYDFVQASFAKSKLDSPSSGEPNNTTATIFELQKDLGYQVVASVSAGFVAWGWWEAAAAPHACPTDPRPQALRQPAESVPEVAGTPACCSRIAASWGRGALIAGTDAGLAIACLRPPTALPPRA